MDLITSDSISTPVVYVTSYVSLNDNIPLYHIYITFSESHIKQPPITPSNCDNIGFPNSKQDTSKKRKCVK